MKTPTIAQHNYLIRSHLSFSNLEARIFAILLSNLRKGDKDFKHIQVNLSEVVEYKPSVKVYELFKEAIDRLADKRLKVLEHDNGYHYRNISFFDEIEYTAKKGVVKILFGQTIRPYLLQLKDNFTLAEIEQVLTLKSGYAHRLYWILKSYEFKGEYVEDVEEFKNMMLGAEAENAKKYERFFDFKKYVLFPSLEEVNKMINVQLTELKKGRQTVGLKFTFGKEAPKQILKAKIVLPDLFNQPTEPEQIKWQGHQLTAFNLMVKYDLSARQADYFLSKIDSLIITKTISDVYGRRKSEVQDKDRAGLIYNALKRKIDPKSEDLK